MNVRTEETREGWEILGDAEIELPYVFYSPPKYQVNITFALWCGLEEIVLKEQPFPVNKDLFYRTISGARRRNPLMFVLGTLGIPFMTARYCVTGNCSLKKALKKSNELVHDLSGFSYSSRQRNTDYFASMYNHFVDKTAQVNSKNVLFLSERLPEEDGNLLLIKQEIEREEGICITEFMNTKRIDQLSRSEIKECARKCAKARVIILEDFYPQLHSIRIRPETKVVQLWHACGAFKTFGLSRIGKQGGAPQSSMNHRNYNMVPVSGERIRDLYSEAFAISSERVKALGVPRTDLLFQWEYKHRERERLCKEYPILRENKVVLYAPTFRGDGNKEAFFPLEKFPVGEFMEKMPEDTVLVIKNHPFVSQHFSIPEQWKDQVLDLSDTEHINQLMLVSDLLITDYSSSIFEAAILELPMLFYAFDQEEYTRDRDFYFAYDEMTPGPVAKDLGELTRYAHDMLSGGRYPEVDDLMIRMEEFRETFLSALDGNSTKRVTRYILDTYLLD